MSCFGHAVESLTRALNPRLTGPMSALSAGSRLSSLSVAKVVVTQRVNSARVGGVRIRDFPERVNARSGADGRGSA